MQNKHTNMRQRPSLSALIILCFVFADVSVSVALPFGVLFKVPSWCKKIPIKNCAANLWNKLRSLISRHLDVNDIADGLCELKQHMDSLGRFNSTLSCTNNFTSDLQSALEEYQINFNLSVTGQPDRETLLQMSQPRCGVPDFINGSTTMNSIWKHNTTLSFKPWWHAGKTELTYAFSLDENSFTVAYNVTKAVFRDAFNSWSKYTSLNFTETASLKDWDIQITFLSIDGKGGTVGGAAMNSSMGTAGIVLDSDEDWVLTTENLTKENDVDLESVVMHQIGHLLGLGHSSVEAAIMYPSILPSKRKIVLANDDIERLEKLYGTNPSVGNTTTGDGGRIAEVGLMGGLVTALCIAFAFMVILIN